MLLMSKFRKPVFGHGFDFRPLFVTSLALTRPRVNTNARRLKSDSITTKTEHDDEGGKHRQETFLQRAQLIDILTQKHALSKTQATQILKTVFDTIVEVCQLVRARSSEGRRASTNQYKCTIY